MKRLLKSHVVAFAFFVPFAAMLAAHRVLGLSDAMMVAPEPGRPHSMLFNMLMVFCFQMGVLGYILHVALVADRKPIWIVAKCVLLGVFWAVTLELL